MRNHSTAPGACTDMEFFLPQKHSVVGSHLTWSGTTPWIRYCIKLTAIYSVDVGDVVTILMSKAKYVKPMHF